MSILKKLFGTLSQKPWEENQAAIDSTHSGRTFNLSNQMSAVIIIFGVSTAIFSLIFSGYLYSLPPEQDTTFILKTNLDLSIPLDQDHKLEVKKIGDEYIPFVHVRNNIEGFLSRSVYYSLIEIALRQDNVFEGQLSLTSFDCVFDLGNIND